LAIDVPVGRLVAAANQRDQGAQARHEAFDFNSLPVPRGRDVILNRACRVPCRRNRQARRAFGSMGPTGRY